VSPAAGPDAHPAHKSSVHLQLVGGGGAEEEESGGSRRRPGLVGEDRRRGQ